MASHAIAAEVQRAASAIRNAGALFITAGAGMGVDSGLPDFRGPEGFWKAYPPLRKLKLHLSEMSNPMWFDNDPKFAWGFFGHRYNLYSKAKPHKGFDILLKWCRAAKDGYFVFTSNVDGHFQKAGFDEDRVVECHGTIHFQQCADPSKDHTIWPVPDGTSYDVDDETLRLRGPLPLGPPPQNNVLARPNILMFGDYAWVSTRTDAQWERLQTFRRQLQKKNVPSVVIEIGAGTAVPTVRMMSEEMASLNTTLIRINPLEPEVPSSQHIGLSKKGLEALQAIDEALSAEGART